MGLPITMPAFFDAGEVLPFFPAGNGKPLPAGRIKIFCGACHIPLLCLVLRANGRGSFS